MKRLLFAGLTLAGVALVGRVGYTAGEGVHASAEPALTSAGAADDKPADGGKPGQTPGGHGPQAPMGTIPMAPGPMAGGPYVPSSLVGGYGGGYAGGYAAPDLG